jgi:hypothetical protein
VRWSALQSYHSCVRGVSTGYRLDSKNIPRKRQYIGQVNPNFERMKLVPGALSPEVKRSGRESEIQRVFLSLQCPLRLGGLRAGHAGLDSRQGQDVSPLHNIQTGFGVNQPPIRGSFSGGKNLCKLSLFLYNAIINFSSSFISYGIPGNAGYLCKYTYIERERERSKTIH